MTELYTDDNDWDDNYALATLLQDQVVFCNSIYYNKEYYITQYVICNDIFAWGMADSEQMSCGDIEDLYKMHTADKQWGSTKWCCIHRNKQPQDPVKKAMQDAGVWNERMEALPENEFSKRIRERNEQRLSDI